MVRLRLRLGLGRGLGLGLVLGIGENVAKWLKLVNFIKKTQKAIYFTTNRYKIAGFGKISE